jgi:hypothetical protein
MIYSRFGTKLTPLSKRQDADGRISIQATAEGGEGVRDYAVADLTADDGLGEINGTVAALAWYMADKSAPPRGQRQRRRAL